MNSKVLDIYLPDTLLLVDPATLEPPTWTKWKTESENDDSRPQNRKRKQDLSETVQPKNDCKKAKNKKDLLHEMNPEEHRGNPTYQKKIEKSQKSKDYREKQKSKLVTAMAQLAQEQQNVQALEIENERLQKQNLLLQKEIYALMATQSFGIKTDK